MAKTKLEFLEKPSCTSCRKAKAHLEGLGAELVLRNLDTKRLSEKELDELIGERDHLDFLNTRNELYRQKKMKEHPPTRAQAIQLMAKNPNLIRRPVVKRGARIVLGFDPESYRALVK